MIEDMVQVKLAVEGMKAQIIKCFDAKQIAAGIRAATDKAVAEFDMQSYIDKVVGQVFYSAADYVREQLREEYGHRLFSRISDMVDAKLDEILLDGDDQCNPSDEA